MSYFSDRKSSFQKNQNVHKENLAIQNSQTIGYPFSSLMKSACHIIYMAKPVFTGLWENCGSWDKKEKFFLRKNS
jgi:hypothetical protein